MLKKGERICPVCGKKLRLRAPSNSDADGKDIIEGYPSFAVRTRWSILPYTVYPHRDHNVPIGRGGVPWRVSSKEIHIFLANDGLLLYRTYLVFFCEECSSRLSLNFNPQGLLIALLWGLALVVPLLSVGAGHPEIFSCWWAILILLLFAAVFAGWVGCMIYIRRNLSNFVPVDQYDALINPTTELSLSPEGLPKKWLHESNIFTTEINRQKYQLYLAKKEKKQLWFSVCGINGEQKRFIELMEHGVTMLDLTFEGKSVGTAQVLSCGLPPEDKEQ